MQASVEGAWSSVITHRTAPRLLVSLQGEAEINGVINNTALVLALWQVGSGLLLAACCLIPL